MRQPAHLALTCLLALAATLATPLAPAAQGPGAAPLHIRIGYLGYRPASGPLLSNVIPEPGDAGLQGAELAIVDSNSTGRFLKQQFQLTSANVDSPEALLQAARAQHDQGLRLFVVNAPAASLRALSTALPDSLLFNAGSPDDSLRSSQCLGNVLHSLPSRAMLADALACACSAALSPRRSSVNKVLNLPGRVMASQRDLSCAENCKGKSCGTAC